MVVLCKAWPCDACVRLQNTLKLAGVGAEKEGRGSVPSVREKHCV